MKKNLNVIQIKGIKGLILLILIGTCLFAGFIVYPGWMAMHIWNFLASWSGSVPLIGLVQGTLLWGIVIAIFLIVRKEHIVIRIKSPKGLSEEELKSVFSDIKKQSADDKIIQAMMKARETELKLKDSEQEEVTQSETK